MAISKKAKLIGVLSLSQIQVQQDDDGMAPMTAEDGAYGPAGW